MITRVSIVYSVAQEVIRSITHFDRVADPNDPRGWRNMTQPEMDAFDEDKAIAARQAALLLGEAHTTIPHANYHAIQTHQGIHDALGLRGVAGVDDRHVTINKGVVSAVHLCDPAIDCPGGVWRNTDNMARFNGHVLAHNPNAQVGDSVDQGQQ